MKLRLHLLRRDEAITALLRHAGWHLEATTPNQLAACHPAVTGEREARRHLHELGLLTSAALRIEFPVRPTAKRHLLVRGG